MSPEYCAPSEVVTSIPIPVSNTLVFTGLVGQGDFSPRIIDQLRFDVANLSNDSLIHWGPLPSFARIFAVFKSPSAALEIRTHFDGYLYNGKSIIRVYFADDTPIEPLLLKHRKGGLLSAIERERDTTHLKLPDAGRLFLISPPPSPPIGWESQEEPPPNSDTGIPADVLSQALDKLALAKDADVADMNRNATVNGQSDKTHVEEAGTIVNFELYSDSASVVSTPGSPAIVIVPADNDPRKPSIVVSDYSSNRQQANWL